MRVGIDIRCLAEGKVSGVEEYLVRTLKETFKRDNKNQYILFFNSFRGSRENLDWLKKYPNVEIRDFRFPNKFFNLSLWLLRWPKIDRLIGGVNKFFAPNIGFIALSKDCRKVLTIHDLSFERFAETFSWKRRLWHFMVNPRLLCQEADVVCSVSESTKQDLISLYGIPSGKIKIAFPPIEDWHERQPQLMQGKKEEIQKKYGISRKFILYLGTIEPRKNIVGLMEAYEALRQEWPQSSQYELVIAGARGWKCEQIFQRHAHSEYRSDIRFTDFVDDDDKEDLYSLAEVVVYPSFFEGFGFPPIEAMAAGTPVITSNCSSIPEIVGDGAILIDPYRPYEITLALRQLLEDDRLRQEYIIRGRQRVSQLSQLPRVLPLEC